VRVILYLLALPPAKGQQANAGCWKCRGLLVAPTSMRKVRTALEGFEGGAVFACAKCIPEDKSRVLLTLAQIDDALALERAEGN
jgi:hypothetical protein